MQILSTVRHAEGKDHAVCTNDSFWFRGTSTSWGQMGHSQQHCANPCTPPAGIKTFQEVQRGQIWSCLLMSCAFNLSNDLGETQTHRRLLTMTGQINEHSQLFSPLAARDLLVHAKENKLKEKKIHTWQVSISLNITCCLEEEWEHQCFDEAGRGWGDDMITPLMN